MTTAYDYVKWKMRAVWMAQWWRIRLPMQETRVSPLVWEDPTCHQTTKTTLHNDWGSTLEPKTHTTEAVRLEPVLSNKGSRSNKKSMQHTWSVAATHHIYRKPTHQWRSKQILNFFKKRKDNNVLRDRKDKLGMPCFKLPWWLRR